MIGTPHATRCAVLALLISAAAFSYCLGVEAARHTCQIRPIAQLIR
jgi:hypothetical protein